ncbi:hypothetical protein ABIB37_000399 [Agrococcus sp. UYP10]|uniref:DUF3263 domain-containing protein n=1 Tax=Agrococcus sp. UYP10 TaxID=1756355 RepID=UPI00339A71CD
MSTEPRHRSKGTADEAAALAFAAAEAARPEHDGIGEATDAATGPGTAADDLARAREERIRAVLDFEAGWSSHGGAKARAIRTEFGWSTTRYYQVLDAAIETPQALHHDPMLVRRLLRLRDGA